MTATVLPDADFRHPDTWPVKPDAWCTVVVRGRELVVAAMPHPDLTGLPGPCAGDRRFTDDNTSQMSGRVLAQLASVCVSCPTARRVACHWWALANDTENYAAGMTAGERRNLRRDLGIHGVQSDDLHLYGLGVDWREHVVPVLAGTVEDWEWDCE